MTDRSETPSVIDQVKGFEWSSEESVAFEVAIEAANAVVGAYSARIAAENAKGSPDPAVVASCRSGMAQITCRRQELDPTDHDAIARARHEFIELAQAVREGRA